MTLNGPQPLDVQPTKGAERYRNRIISCSSSMRAKSSAFLKLLRIDRSFVPRLERGVVIWTAHFQREIWTAEHERLANQTKCDKQGGFGENEDGIQAYPRTDLADNTTDRLSPQVVRPLPRKGRGRPNRIPDERKVRALAVEGITNRAQILYQTRYPTPQQKKNVRILNPEALQEEGNGG